MVFGVQRVKEADGTEKIFGQAISLKRYSDGHFYLSRFALLLKPLDQGEFVVAHDRMLRSVKVDPGEPVPIRFSFARS